MYTYIQYLSSRCMYVCSDTLVVSVICIIGMSCTVYLDYYWLQQTLYIRHCWLPLYRHCYIWQSVSCCITVPHNLLSGNCTSDRLPWQVDAATEPHLTGSVLFLPLYDLQGNVLASVVRTPDGPTQVRHLTRTVCKCSATLRSDSESNKPSIRLNHHVKFPQLHMRYL